MIVFSDHAREAMEEHGFTAAEVQAALEHGSRFGKKLVDGELRYGSALEIKGKILIVVWTFREHDIRIITCYPLRAKQWQ